MKSTCTGALAAGFEVVLLSGAHSTYDVDGQTAMNIERDVEDSLRRENVKIMDWKEWLQ